MYNCRVHCTLFQRDGERTMFGFNSDLAVVVDGVVREGYASCIIYFDYEGSDKSVHIGYEHYFNESFVCFLLEMEIMRQKIISCYNSSL